MGNSGSAGEVARAGSTGLALIVAVEGVGGVSLDGVWQETEAVGLYGMAVGTGAARVVEGCLEGLAASVASGNTPAGSSDAHDLASDDSRAERSGNGEQQEKRGWWSHIWNCH